MDRAHWQKLTDRADDAHEERERRREKLKATPEHAALMDAWVDVIEARRAALAAWYKLPARTRHRINLERESTRAMEKSESADAERVEP